MIHLEHRIRHCVEVSTTHDVDLSLLDTNLNRLEIVWEVAWALYCVMCHTLGFGVVQVEALRIFLHYVDIELLDLRY